MSAQRRTATKRRTTASAVGNGVAPSASTRQSQAAAPAAPAKSRPAAERDRPKVAAPGRGEALTARTQGVRKLIRDTMAEMRKINWPDQETTRNLTIVVIGISAVLGLLLGGIDFILLKLLELLP